MNDTERAQWVDNDEGLYLDMKASRMGMRAYVRANRVEIDRVVSAACTPRVKTWRDYA